MRNVQHTLKRCGKKNIKSIFETITIESRSKGVNVYEFVGKIHLKKDALSIQKEMRNEWQ